MRPGCPRTPAKLSALQNSRIALGYSPFQRSGVGPGLAMMLLSGMNADEMVASIRTNNLARLVSIPGVGRKTAERLVVDLRDKIAALSSPALEEEFAAKAAAAGAPTSEDSIRNDALS